LLPELGHLFLISAFVVAMLQVGLLCMSCFTQKNKLLCQFTYVPLTVAQGLFILISYLALTYAFVSNDFSVAYTAYNSNQLLPLMYRISAVWGAHEGSLLLWILMLSVWSVALALWSRRYPLERFSVVLGVLAFISAGFLAFILFTSNPFERLLPYSPIQGADLNPLLQDIGLIVHPPILYMGYVGFSVAFAFAVAGLISGNIDQQWLRWCRPWTLLAFAFLSLGITLGSWWAYYELGWGGWWFWDPVENASLLPWLVGAALIHSLVASESRGLFKSWTILLAILAFSLSLLGTFLVRSGVLTSVHAFANDPERGLFILVFLFIIVGGALALYAWRAFQLQSEAHFAWLSRETLILVNNLVLIVACATVLLGTIYPLILDALTGEKISIGPPYFNLLFTPLGLLLVFLTAFGPLSVWKKMDVFEVWRRLRYVLLASLIVGIGLPLWLTDSVTPLFLFSTTLATWLILASLEDVARRARYEWRAVFKLKMTYYGMIIAHLGLAVMLIGIACVTHYEVEREIRMTIGERVDVGPYSFTLSKIQDVQGSNYHGTAGIFAVAYQGKELTVMQPEKRLYFIRNLPITETAIKPGFFSDLYVALGEPLPDQSWSVRIYYKPFIRWIWLGGLMMALGSLLSAMTRWHRLKKEN